MHLQKSNGWWMVAIQTIWSKMQISSALLTDQSKQKVKLGNGAIVEAQGKGTMVIQTKKATKQISDVLFIPVLD